MVRDDVDLVERLYAEGGPFKLPLGPADEDALLDRLFDQFYDEQLEAHMPPDYPEGEQVYVGRRGMSALIATLRDSWTEWHFEAERFMAARGCVVVLIRVVATGGVSGVPSARKTAHVWTVRHGRLSSIRIYRDRDEALGAVVLSNGSDAGADG